MASVVVERTERERPLAFGTGGRLGFVFWRMQIQTILFFGAFGLFPLSLRDQKDEIPWAFPVSLLICFGWSIVESIRMLRRDQRDYRLFLESQRGVDIPVAELDRFFTGIRATSPVNGGRKGEIIKILLMILLIWEILSFSIGRSDTGDLNLWVNVSLSCSVGLLLLSMTQIVMSFFRPAKKEEVIITRHGIMWANRDPDWSGMFPNEFFPWSCIERVVVFDGDLWRDKKLQIDVDRWPWYRKIRFAKIRDEDWNRMLGMIGERVKVSTKK